MNEKENLETLDWETFSSYNIEKRIEFFSNHSENFGVLFAQQFDRNFLGKLYQLSNKIRAIAKSTEGKRWLMSLLKHYRAMLYFVQPSTRTFLSFSSACEIFGIQCTDVRSIETSSEVKGEVFEDTIRTFSSFFDLIIMRHPQKGYAEKAAFVLNTSPRPVPLINAGSSDDQHPTQALLDIYTLEKSFSQLGGLDGKTIIMVGDLKRGRTVRSLCYLLTLFQDIRIIFSSPKAFQMKDDIKNFLQKKKVNFIESEKMEEHLKDGDAIYITRIQQEHDQKGSVKFSESERERFKLRKEHLNLMKKNAVILHPLPRQNEIEKTIDADPRAMYWRQVRNGMWTRSALIATIFDIEDKIFNYKIDKK